MKALIMLLNVVLWILLRPIAFYCDYLLFEKGRVFRNPNAITQDPIIFVVEIFLLLWAITFYVKYFFKREDNVKTKTLKLGIFVIFAMLFYITSSIITALFYMLMHKSWI